MSDLLDELDDELYKGPLDAVTVFVTCPIVCGFFTNCILADF